MRPAALASVCAAVTIVLAGCGGGASAPEPPPAGRATGDTLSGLAVLAASSLTDAFSEIGDAFRRARPGVELTFDFGPSSGLAAPVLEGAPADVLAAASPDPVTPLVEAGLVEGETPDFAGNLLEIAVEPGNPLGIRALGDLTRDDVILVLAAGEVPAGRYADEALARAGVDVSPSSREADVRAVLSKVELGEADAGIVYHTDVVAAGDAVDGVEIPAEDNVVARYPIAALAGSANPATAAAFVDFVLSAPGQRILRAHGFAAP